MGGEVAVADVRADSEHRAVGALYLLHAVERQVAHVDEAVGAGDAELEVVHEVGAAGQEPRTGVGADQGDGLGGVGGADVVVLLHASLPAASRTAARMPT